jgi:Skp family chaperone for outer membrane proteins
MKASLEQQQLAAENALTKRAQAFEQEVMAYQQKVSSGTMTPKSAEEEQTRLARKEQTIMAERERLTNELLKATDDFNSQFTSKVKEYLDSLKAQRNYDYILVTGTGSPVLLSNEQLDITDEVLRLLNQQGQ